MQNETPRIEHRGYTQQRISFVCVVLCAILFAVLGVLPKIPASITQVFRPIFIFFSFFVIRRGFYPLGAAKWQIVNLVYYTIILISNPITSTAITIYISIVLFGFFFICAVSIPWNKREIALLFFVVVLACDIQVLGILYSNPHLLTSGGNQHIYFLGVQLNRNPVAFAITPGVLSSLFILLYGKGKGLSLRTVFSAVSFLLCSYLVFALGCRSAFLSAVVGALLIMWQKTKDGRNSQDRFSRRVFLLIFVLLVLFLALNLASGNYSERLFDLKNDSGRDEIWEYAWTLIDAKPVFGGGFDYWAEGGLDMGTHNSVITIILYSGYVGGALLIIFLIALLAECLKVRNLVPLAYLAEMLYHTYSESSMDYYAYIPMILAFVLLRYMKYRNKDLYTLFI